MARTSQRDFAKFDERRARTVETQVVSPRTGGGGGGRRPRRRSRLWVRLVKWGVVLGLLGSIAALVGYWALIFYFEHRLPDIFESGDYVARTPELTRILSANGDVLDEMGSERRTVVPDEDIPKLVKAAVLAAEDADFYHHAGLDYLGMARAMYKNVRDGRFSQGASTITQQVAKTFFLSSERTIQRKLKEVVLARRLEHELTKDEILYLYLNQIYWGHGRYGIAEAARFYFDKDLKSLTLADAALLAGLIAAPERFTPFRDKVRAAERRAFVLDQMAAHQFIAPDQAEAAKREPIRLNFRQDPHEGLAPYAMDVVRRQLVAALGPERVRKGGLRVYTTIDTRLQREAEAAVRRGLEAVDRRYDLAKPLEHLPDGRIGQFIRKLQKSLPPRGVRSGEVTVGVVTEIEREAEEYVVHVGLGAGAIPFGSVERYLGRLKAHELLRVGDVVRVSPRYDLVDPWTEGRPQLNLDQGPQAALVALDPRTRYIRAMVGGYGHATHPFNRAEMARRQAGSTFKPIVYAAALESGIIDPETELRNVPESYKTGGGRYWKPQNFSRRFDGKLYTARLALAKSINVIAVQVLEKTGVSRVIDFARRIGIEADIARDLSIALGSTAVTPLELANAYATFAAGGTVQEPMLITRIEDASGQVLYEAPRKPRRGTTAKVAYRITEMLSAVVTHGTAKKLGSLGRPIAGKTGTTDEGIDTWFAGYTPDLVTTVWVGFDDRRPVEKATGGSVAAPIWGQFMAAAVEGTEVAGFLPPAGVDPLPPVRAPVAPVEAADAESPSPGSPSPGVTQQMELLYQ